MNQEECKEIKQALELFLNESLERILMSNPTDSGKISRSRIRPLFMKGRLVFQAEEQAGKQAFHRNLDKDEAADYVTGLLEGAFRQAEITSGLGKALILVSKKGKVTVKVKRYPRSVRIQPAGESGSPGFLPHNRKKHYILEEGIPVPFLVDLGVMTKEGRVVNMGVENIITFDAHDPRVQNAIPLRGFETVQPIYQFLKYLLKNETDLQIDSSHMMVISPDEGGTGRAVYFSNMLGLDMGMFYKRRDYTKIVGGRNPIVAHEFLGASVEGKDVLIIDDMISSGESVMDVAKELKRRKAGKVFVCATFGLFTGGLTKFDEYYDKGTWYIRPRIFLRDHTILMWI